MENGNIPIQRRKLRLRSMQMIPIMNDMIDMITTRDVSRITRVAPLMSDCVSRYCCRFLLGLTTRAKNGIYFANRLCIDNDSYA